MEKSGKSQQAVYHINVNVHTVQEGAQTTVEETVTNIIDPAIEQLNINQQGANNDAPGDPVGGEQDEIDSEVSETNLSPRSPISAPVKEKRSTSSDQSDSTKSGLAEENRKGIFHNIRKIFSKETSSSESDKKDETKSKERSFGAKENEKSISIRCELLKGRASALCAQSKFHGASSCLEQLTSIQGEKDLTTVLLQTECNLQLGREKKADKNIDDIKTLLMPSPSNVDDVINFAGDLIVDKSYVRASVLLRIASEMYKTDTTLSPDDVVERIQVCVSKNHDAIEAMIKSGGKLKEIALDYFLPFMVEMLDFLRAVENADPTIKEKCEAWCVNFIGVNYYLAGEYEKSIKFYKTGVDAMVRQFGKKASKHQVYDILLRNIDASNCSLGRYGRAKGYYRKSLDENINASDFGKEDEKQKNIEKNAK